MNRYTQDFLDRAQATFFAIEHNQYDNPIVQKIAEQAAIGGLNAYNRYTRVLSQTPSITEELSALWCSIDSIREYGDNVDSEFVEAAINGGLSVIDDMLEAYLIEQLEIFTKQYKDNK